MLPTTGLRRGQTMGTAKRSVVARGWGREDSEQAEHGGVFRAVELLRKVPWWRIHTVARSPKLGECTPPRANPKVNCRLWGLTTFGAGPSIVPMRHVGEDVDDGGGVCVRGRGHVETLCTCLSILLWTKNRSKNIMSRKKEKEIKKQRNKQTKPLRKNMSIEVNFNTSSGKKKKAWNRAGNIYSTYTIELMPKYMKKSHKSIG